MEGLRVGIGYDAHRLVTGRPLIMGGVQIAFEKGLEGHSDADVVVHAVCDALLGAAGLGDIGRYFPDSDDRYKDVSSLLLLEKVRKMLGDSGFCVVNVDVTVVAQAPKISSYTHEMSCNIASRTGLTPDAVNIKGTTTEGMGFAGSGEGIAAYAVAMIF